MAWNIRLGVAMVRCESGAGRRENLFHFCVFMLLIYGIILHVKKVVRFNQCCLVLLLFVRNTYRE